MEHQDPRRWAWHPTPNAWHGVHEMDGMHVLIGSRRPSLTGCPYFYPWLHVTVFFSTGKCTQPPCVLTPFRDTASLIPLPPFLFFHSVLQQSAGNPKGRPQDTRPGPRMEGKREPKDAMHAFECSVHNVCSFVKAVPGHGRETGPEVLGVGLKKRPPGQALRHYGARPRQPARGKRSLGRDPSQAA